MDRDGQRLNGGIALVALCHEYCMTVDDAESMAAGDFARLILALLSRIYVTALDLPDAPEDAVDIAGALDEEQYAGVAASMARIFGENDTYLDASHEDMKYSETPVAANLSEHLADLYQDFYDFTALARELPADSLYEATAEMRERFSQYWSNTLCKAMGVLNSLYMSGVLAEEDL